jgi:hypothetical protein
VVGTIDIKEHMEIIGADGAFVGKVDKIEGDRIKLTKDDGRGGKRDHHHFLPIGLVADIEGDKVRLSATAANALTFQEEETGAARRTALRPPRKAHSRSAVRPTRRPRWRPRRTRPPRPSPRPRRSARLRWVRPPWVPRRLVRPS